ncbi:MAG: c-type cytochrome domain-containing protein [Pirellulaceae bacterium]
MTKLSAVLPWLCGLIFASGLVNYEGLGQSPLLAEDVSQPAAISYRGQVEPIFRAHCQGCHQPANAQGEFVMSDFARLLGTGESGEVAVVPGDSEASYLVAQITPADGVAAMPKKGQSLGADEIDLIRRWIDQGAVNDSPVTGLEYDAEHPPEYTRPPLITAARLLTRWKVVGGFGLSRSAIG